MATQLSAEIFKRTAPKWNCVDYPGEGMHFRPAAGGGCAWCGETSEEIARQDARVITRPDGPLARPDQPYEVAWIWMGDHPGISTRYTEVMARDAAHAIEVHRAELADNRSGVPSNYVPVGVAQLFR